MGDTRICKCFIEGGRMGILLAGLLLMAVQPSAAVKKSNLRIKVLDSDSRTFITNDNPIPKNCDMLNYDGYCHSSKTEEIINTLLVQVDDEPPYRVKCVVETKWSSCAQLLQGVSFDAKPEKNGLTIYYLDRKGRLRKQLYTYDADGKRNSAIRDLTAAKEISPVQAGSAAAEATPQSVAKDVKCSFTSNPPGAEISVDGRYVGSTPSVVNVKTGAHEVKVSMPGFAQWKKELEVSLGSQLTVNAILERLH